MPGSAVMMTVLTALSDGCYYQCDTEKAGSENSSQGPAESRACVHAFSEIQGAVSPSLQSLPVLYPALKRLH